MTVRDLAEDVGHGTLMFVVLLVIGCALLTAVMFPLWLIIRLSDWLGPDMAQAAILFVGMWIACIWYVRSDA